MADFLRDLWPVWLFFTVLGWAGDAVSARLIYWQRRQIEELKRSATSRLPARSDTDGAA